jgi:hypothetical protein
MDIRDAQGDVRTTFNGGFGGPTGVECALVRVNGGLAAVPRGRNVDSPRSGRS